MRKKVLLSFLVLIALFMVTGCGNSEKKEDNKGSNEKKNYVMYENGDKYTFEELQAKSKENAVAFKEKYCNVPGTIVAKLTKITNYKYNYGSTTLLEIWLEGSDSWSNYTAKIDYDKYKDLIMDIKTGDYLKLTTDNIGCTFYTDFSRIEVSNPTVELVK